MEYCKKNFFGLIIKLLIMMRVIVFDIELMNFNMNFIMYLRIVLIFLVLLFDRVGL